MGWFKRSSVSLRGNLTRRARPAVPAHKPGLYRLETLEPRILLSADPLQAAGLLVADKILPAPQVLILEEPSRSSSPVVEWGREEGPQADRQGEVEQADPPTLVANDQPTLTGIPGSEPGEGYPG